MGVFEQQIINFQQQDEFWERTSLTKRRDSEEFMDHTFLNMISSSYSNRFSNSDYVNNLNSTRIQPVLKIISQQTGVTQVKQLIDYIVREKKSEEEKLSIEEDAGKNLGSKDARDKLIEEWKKDFFDKETYKKQEWKNEIMSKMYEERDNLEAIPENKQTLEQQVKLDELHQQINGQYQIVRKVNSKTNQLEETKRSLKIRGANDTTHVMLSVGGKPDPTQATRATRKFLQENLAAAGFKYAFVRHDDTSNLHFHVVIKSRGEFGQRLRFDKPDLFILRQEYARCLTEMGIERVATKRLDRTAEIEKVKADLKQIKENDSWYKNQLKKIEPEKGQGISNNKKDKSRDFDVFSYRANLLKRTVSIIRPLENSIKLAKGADKDNLKEELHKLKIFKEQIKTITPEQFHIAQEKTINALAKDNERLIYKLQKIIKPQTHKRQKTKEQKEFSKKYLKDLTNRNIKSLKVAKEEILANLENKYLTQKQRDEGIKYLRQVNGIIKETKKISKERGFGFGF